MRVLASAAILVVLSGCNPQPELVSFGPDVQSDLVVLFKKGTSGSEMYEFVSATISTPHPGGGFQNLPGLMSVLKVRVGECDGYALRFRETATNSEKAAIRSRVESAQITKQVVENAIPNQLKLCPAA
jgi:hypothetical protein